MNTEILDNEAVQTDDFYKTEIRRMLAEIKLKNQKMEETQTEIDLMEKKSAENLKRIEAKIQEIESILM